MVKQEIWQEILNSGKNIFAVQLNQFLILSISCASSVVPQNYVDFLAQTKKKKKKEGYDAFKFRHLLVILKAKSGKRVVDLLYCLALLGRRLHPAVRRRRQYCPCFSSLKTKVMEYLVTKHTSKTGERANAIFCRGSWLVAKFRILVLLCHFATGTEPSWLEFVE